MMLAASLLGAILQGKGRRVVLESCHFVNGSGTQESNRLFFGVIDIWDIQAWSCTIQ